MQSPSSKTLGVVLPTLNSMPCLPAHLQALEQWQDLAAEIVVVDSFSTDGTNDYLRQRLRHPHLSFFQHPPGLYQSWNFGLRQLQTKYAYVATVGDTITRGGMTSLLHCAQSLDAGVVISKPIFMADETRPAADIRWPIDDLIETLAVPQPRTVSRAGSSAVHRRPSRWDPARQQRQQSLPDGRPAKVPLPRRLRKSGRRRLGGAAFCRCEVGGHPGKILHFFVPPRLDRRGGTPKLQDFNPPGQGFARRGRNGRREWNRSTGRLGSACRLRIARCGQPVAGWQAGFRPVPGRRWPWFLTRRPGTPARAASANPAAFCNGAPGRWPASERSPGPVLEHRNPAAYLPGIAPGRDRRDRRRENLLELVQQPFMAEKFVRLVVVKIGLAQILQVFGVVLVQLDDFFNRAPLRSGNQNS